MTYIFKIGHPPIIFTAIIIIFVFPHKGVQILTLVTPIGLILSYEILMIIFLGKIVRKSDLYWKTYYNTKENVWEDIENSL